MSDPGAQMWTRDSGVLCNSIERGTTYLDEMLKIEVGKGWKRGNKPIQSITWTKIVRLVKCWLSWSDWLCPIRASDQLLCGGHVLHHLSGVSILLKEQDQDSEVQKIKVPTPPVGQKPEFWVLVWGPASFSCVAWAMAITIKEDHANPCPHLVFSVSIWFSAF